MKEVRQNGRIVGLLDWDGKETNNKEKKLTKLNMITGGKPPSDENDWLSPLAVETVFLAKQNAGLNMGQNWAVLSLQVVHKFEKAVMLYENLHNKPFAVVDPTGFCKDFRCLEVVNVPQEKEKENDGASDRVTSKSKGKTRVVPDDEHVA